ncbi:efflux RND transporter permease subunit [Paenibacillus sp. UNC499MF]|uniref:efflux RND transporter permease subunit n=1 Tax=Paenibacillus sp. UNC499MF TaxID=1502751 RepID=UPI00089F88D1|nr:efflux RND transporter permease subunit [Paenibacillus sp. UNC499MF]SEG29419.1 hydrophobic/amphiphilic exporter-1, HAE1 family [Paenibacillus sp. UNC499MF]
MRGIIRYSLNNKLVIWLLTILVTAAGIYAGLSMKQETLPNLEVPVLTVTTVYPGAAPEEVADRITGPLEQKVRSLDGVDVVSSTSMENVSSIVMEYSYKKDMDKAASEVKEAVADFVLPGGAQETKVSKININAFPVVSLSVAGEEQSLDELTRQIENDLIPALEGIPGAASVEISGQHQQEVRLTFDRDKLKAYGLSEDTVKGIIQGAAVQVPLGLYEVGRTEKTLVVDGNVKSLDDLRNLEIPLVPGGAGSAGAAGAAGAAGTGSGAAAGGSAAGGAASGPSGAVPGSAAGVGRAGGAAPAAGASGLPTVKLAELAGIELADRADSISRTNGKESIGIQVVKAPDANTVDVVNAVKEKAAGFRQANRGVETVIMLDQGKPIEDSVNTMLSKAVFGALFAVLIIMLFLRNWRTTLISIVSIPLSLLIGILLLQQMDITLNIMTLGAMTVAIGRVVDDSIVVIENIYRRMSSPTEPLRGKALIREATREMFMPILSSTIVTIAVFLPLGFVSGPVGQLFLPFALTMVFALLASLLVAVTIVPMLGHSMFRRRLERMGPPPVPAYAEGGAPAGLPLGMDPAESIRLRVRGKGQSRRGHDETGRLGRFYRRILDTTLNHKLIAFGTAILLLAGSLLLTTRVGVSFLPEEEQKYAMVTYTPAPGETLEDVKRKALEAEKYVLGRSGVRNLQYSVGGQNPMSPGPSKSALFYVEYDPEFADFTAEKQRLVQGLTETVPGSWKPMDMGGGVGGSKLSLYVYGEKLDEIRAAADKIQALMKNRPAFDKVGSSLSESYGQYTIVADPAKLSKLGLTAGQIAMAFSQERERPVLTKVGVEGKEVEVYVQADKKTYADLSAIENTTVASPLGVEVPLKDVAKIEEGRSPNAVTHRDTKLYAEVSADITSKDVGAASTELKNEIGKLGLPASVRVDFGGVTEQINETFSQLGLAMIAAVAIVYLVLVMFFGGALTPFAILFSLPFTIIGAIVALLVTGETLSVSAMMGALMLIGIVVTNAIVLLDRVIHNEKAGMKTREALLEAAATRLRPILMTALATVGALLPLAFGFESGGLISKGLAVTVIGGLISSTLLTLIIVPVVYEFLAKFRRRRPASELED